MDSLTNRYNEFYKKNFNIICGIDEAGRGPLAGPVFVGAVILPKNYSIIGLADSKKLSSKKREYLFEQIIDQAIDYSISSSTHQEIDDINILQATFLAMKRAVSKLKTKPDILLIDGNRDPHIGIKTDCIVKGDNFIDCISAASILAKVSRDRFMIKLSKQYPEYCFDKHKGYGTKLHYNAIEKFGICPIHRKTFLKNIKINEQ